MRALNRLFARLRNFFFRRHGEARFNEEIASHIEALTEENLRTGMAPAEARRQARLKFGPVESLRQSCHDEEGLPFLEGLLLDLRYSFRVLKKSPAFTLVAVITLMLGVGANVLVFGVLNAVVLSPLEVSQPENLYQLRPKTWMSGRLLTTSYPAFEDLQRRATTFSGIAGMYGYSHAALSWNGTEVKAISGYEVSGNYFDLLGVQPQIGRFFHASDEHGVDSAPYIVLSDTLWRSAFHGDAGVIGATVALNKHPFTILGVTTPQFHGTEKFRWPDYWLPMVNEGQVEGYSYLTNRASVTVTVLGRLKPNVTPEQAVQDLNAIQQELAKEYPNTDSGKPVRLIHPGLIGDEGDVIRGFLWSVSALALLVLVAACANLASLFAARTADRGRELGLRVALGSSKRRLIGQLFIESLLVSSAGGIAGLLTAFVLLKSLDRWHPGVGDHLAVHVDLRVYLAAFGFTIASALLIGLLPIKQAWHSTPLQTMKSEQSGSSPLGRFALRDLLLGLQIAICTLLVVASLVAVRGMESMLRTPMGIQPRNAVRIDIDLSQTALNESEGLEKQQEVIEALRTIPGVTAAGIVNRTPMTGGIHGIPVFQPGTTEFKIDNAALATYVFQMSPGYLDAAGTQLRSGRDFSWHDTASAPYVAVVNDTFARKMWGDRSALGESFILYGHLRQVVGITETGKYHDLQESPQPAVYLPPAQSSSGETVFIVRSPRAPGNLIPAVKTILSKIAPNAPVDMESWNDSLSSVFFPAHAATVALGIMGLLAAMLAVTGVFGMAAYSVSRRLKELGVRIALGARKQQVLRSAIGRPMILLSIGSLLGLMSGLFADSLLQKIVYEPKPRDPLVILGTICIMIFLGLLASAIPARRALSIDPASLIRDE